MSMFIARPYPILIQTLSGFKDDVEYLVTVVKKGNQYEITHELLGQSFIRDSILERKANFGIQYNIPKSLYKDSHQFDMDKLKIESNRLVATHSINAPTMIEKPEIFPFIFTELDLTIQSVNQKSNGLEGFWNNLPSISIPAFSKIANHPTIKFSGNSLSSLFHVERDKKLSSGQMKVSFYLKNEKPFVAKCSEDVFSYLKKSLSGKSGNMLIVYILSHAYALVRQHIVKQEVSGGGVELSELLDQHLYNMESKGVKSWHDDDFNASEAATKMHSFSLSDIEGEK